MAIPAAVVSWAAMPAAQAVAPPSPPCGINGGYGNDGDLIYYTHATDSGIGFRVELWYSATCQSVWGKTVRDNPGQNLGDELGCNIHNDTTNAEGSGWPDDPSNGGNCKTPAFWDRGTLSHAMGWGPSGKIVTTSSW
ncbi:hypothetical protein BCD48_27130 [Pseudofrankia sp. BMG5.36]|nr:hypothetical protein BCD48_27130 [Pseudofrankia sp. BMG5.36]